MVGKIVAAVNKPSRSDEVVDPQQQLKITQDVKAQFESIAPKRPVKPNRSEPDPDADLTCQPDSCQPIPELQKLLSLQTDDQQEGVLSKGGEWVEQDEFVETEYYKQLESIDKQHHTTGSGFIKAAANEGVENYELPNWSENNGGGMKMGASCRSYKSNPATNDWTPSVDGIDQVEYYVSTKPSRSG